ncbi:Nif3-like dinuclear metal center hexameric protein [Thermodesulfobacteriota bacterium]
MFPDIETILKVLDEEFPLTLAEEWDNSGLQVAADKQIIKKILVALDPSPNAVSKAASIDARLLITHHPLIFKAISCIDSKVYPGNVIKEAIKNDVSIIAFHTNLDSARGGFNDILAETLDLDNIDVLGAKENVSGDSFGPGRIGDLPGAVEFSSYVKRVKELFKAKYLKVSGPDDALIKRVAIVGGSGGDMIPEAAKEGADLLITGDIGHHDALNAESCGINIIDAGHFNTERTALGVFIKKMEEIFNNNNMDVTMEIYNEEINPIRDI